MFFKTVSKSLSCGIGNFKIADRKEGFYKIYKWSDTETEIELAFGYQVDRLKFSSVKAVLISEIEKQNVAVNAKNNRFLKEKIF